MTVLEARRWSILALRDWSAGVRARLLLAFFGISTFAALTAGSGIYAIRQVGARLNMVDALVAPTLTSLELSRSAERIIAAGPALLAATDRRQRDKVKAQLEAEAAHLNDALGYLKRTGAESRPLLEIEPFVSLLTANNGKLEIAVGRKLAVSETIAAMRRDVFKINAEVERLLAPTLLVIDSQITAMTEAARTADDGDGGEVGRQLVSLINRRRPAEAAKAQFAAATDMLVEASTTRQLRRLPVLAFQISRALRELGATTAKLDPRLRRLFQEEVEKLRRFIEGPGSIAEARSQEFALITEGRDRISENANLSAKLSAAVDRLTNTTKRNIGDATYDALAVQRLTTQVLVVLVALSLVTSTAIVWLYVGRNIVRRLTALNSGMLAIANGELQTAIASEGADEIAAMGRAVEIFRKNTLERDELLIDRGQAAVRLENEVKERTAELARSIEELRALGEVSQAVNSTINLDTVLSTIIAKAVQLSGTAAGTIWVFNEPSQEFRLRASYGMDDILISGVRAQPIGIGETVVGQAAARRQPIQIPDVQQLDSSSLVLDVILRAGFRALLAIPLLSTDRTVGALVVRRKEPGEFPKQTIDLLQTFGTQSVLAIQNAYMFRDIQDKARALTIASKHKSQFVANMSHELRTPLAAMLGYTELLVDGLFGELPAKAIATLERVQSNGKHLLGLINTVLDISKIEAGQFSLNLGEYAISNLVETVLVATESLASAKGIGLHTEIAPALPHGVGDEQRLTQVLLNLVGNAIKFTDKGEVIVAVRTEGDEFAIDVRDSGPGIPPDELARIFEEFHQVDSSDTRAKGGTGLGLAIAKQIIEMHDGRVCVESQLGAGATFQIRLPVRVKTQEVAA